MAKKGKYRGSSFKQGNMVEMFGVADLLKKIEMANGNIDEACKIAVDKSLDIVGQRSKELLSTHVDTGATLRSYEQKPAEVQDGKITAHVGFDIKEGGLPSIFRDVYDGGTPKSKPIFWRYYAIENTRKQVEDIQRETLNEILRGLK